MADYPSDQDRLKAVEDILLGLLGGPKADYFKDLERLSYLQKLSRSFSDQSDKYNRQLIPYTISQGDSVRYGSKALFLAHDSLELRAELDRLNWQYEQLIADQFETLLLLSNNAAFATQRFRRASTLSIYLTNFGPELIERAEHSLRELASEIDTQVVYEPPPEFGSWYKEVYVKAKTALTSKEAEDALQKVKRGLELKHLYREQAKADLDLSKAATNIAGILATQKNAVVILGSISGIKTTINGHESLAIVALTQEELIEIQNNPQLKKGPLELLELLHNMRGHDFRNREGYDDITLALSTENSNKRNGQRKHKPVSSSRPALPKD